MINARAETITEKPAYRGLIRFDGSSTRWRPEHCLLFGTGTDLPFPGPGLAVRCLESITKERLDVLRQADTILLEELKQSGWYRQTSQAFAVLLPTSTRGMRSVGPATLMAATTSP